MLKRLQTCTSLKRFHWDLNGSRGDAAFGWGEDKAAAANKTPIKQNDRAGKQEGTQVGEQVGRQGSNGSGDKDYAGTFVLAPRFHWGPQVVSYYAVTSAAECTLFLSQTDFLQGMTHSETSQNFRATLGDYVILLLCIYTHIDTQFT